MGSDFNIFWMVPLAAWLVQGILGGTKLIRSECGSDAHVFLEHQSPIKLLSQSVDSKETLSMDADKKSLHNLKISDSGVLITFFLFSMAVSLSFIVALV